MKELLKVQRPVSPEYRVGGVVEGKTSQRAVYCHLGCVETIMQQAAQVGLKEVGGLLAGQACWDEQGEWLDLQVALPATEATGSRVSLTFTHDAWDEMLAALEQHCPGGRVMGWYHTHPGLGIFLSSQDLFIQQSFFTAPHQVALVVDPQQFAWAPFIWEQGELQVASEFCVYARPGEEFPALSVALEGVTESRAGGEEWISIT